MGHREGEKLLGAYLPPEFAAAVAGLAKAHGVSRSDLIRAALLRAALGLANDETSTPRRGVS